MAPINQLDKSNYFKGLLLLIRKNKSIQQSEKQLMKHIGITLGFDKVFCEEAIKNLFINEYLGNEPPTFSNPELAKAFILDGITIARSDFILSDDEKSWLYSTAVSNNIEPHWIREKFNTEEDSSDPANKPLEIDRLIIE
ncbi:MAG: hypothetical protein JEY94_16605 [Melioribacteraceae bacterium]|nr:hypothetical protein [Melioribacteraceae bacterium]